MGAVLAAGNTLIIGFGNLDRADDGVGYYVVNALRQHLLQRSLQEEESGLESLGERPDSVFLRQLVPELMETASGYDRVIFVDAHVHEDAAELCCAQLKPEYVPSPFTHHVTPATFLAVMKALYGREPDAYLLSIRGHDFDFHRGLSPAVQRLVEPAVEDLLRLLCRNESQGEA